MHSAVNEQKSGAKQRIGKNKGNRREITIPGGSRLRATAAIAMVLAQAFPAAIAQDKVGVAGGANPEPVMQELPPAPAPNYTQPLDLRSTARDYTKPKSHMWNLVAPYMPNSVDKPNLLNSPRMGDLVRDGKIYLSLSDAIALAIENNFDIAIARYNLDIADTDLLRARAGATLRGVSTGVIANTLGGTSTTLTSGGGPGGTSTGSGGAGTGSSGLVLSTSGAGPAPASYDPTITGTIKFERATSQQTSTILTGTNVYDQNQNSYNFGYSQNFVTGTGLQFTFNNSRTTSNSQRSYYVPQLQSTYNVQLTQHLLQGFGISLNRRFIVQAINDRRITDASFRQQLLYTVNQVENIYWALVSAYEDVQAKERALEQSKQLTSDNRKQLQIGTLAPLDVVNSDSQVATDQQSLIVSQSNFEYQQMIIKQAIARNLDDPILTKAPVIPTDRVNLLQTQEEQRPAEELIQEAYANRPEVEQDILALKNDQITLKGVKNGLLPTVDLVAFYGGSALGGKQNPNLNCGTSDDFTSCPPGTAPTIGLNNVLANTFNGSYPDRGIALNINVPLRNRVAQADQVRSLLEYRQAQMRLEQVYTQIRMQVINGQFALTNDRAQVQSALAAREYAYQSLDAERKKYKLGASTTANVLQQQRNLATAENNVISATATYAKDRAALDQILAKTLERYGITMGDAVSGKMSALPVIPGLKPAEPKSEPKIPQQQEQLKQEQQAQPVPDMPQQPAPLPKQ